MPEICNRATKRSSGEYTCCATDPPRLKRQASSGENAHESQLTSRRPLTGIFQPLDVAESFVEKLDADGLDYFNTVSSKRFSTQAVAFLNAYWKEISDQAEFIFSVSYEIIKYADMHANGVTLACHYNEGKDLDFDMALYFFEQLNKFVDDEKNVQPWGSGSKFAYSQPRMMTALHRKHELKRVDCNFDGRVSFLEYLLYQYRRVCNPADFVRRARALEQPDNTAVEAAMQALADVQLQIRAYEAEKSRLVEAISQESGVRQLSAKNTLAQLDSSPLAEKLNAALIKAEAKVRIATKKFGKPQSTEAVRMSPPHRTCAEELSMGGNSGAIWWMNRDLAEKQKRCARSVKAK
jgi:hypothetical protein